MTIVVTGANGQLGKEIEQAIITGRCEVGEIELDVLNSKLILLSKDDLDITNYDDVLNKMNNFSPDIIINCAAYTDVDRCEDHPDIAYQINSIGAKNLAIIANKIQAKLVHISTDYVFSGYARNPFKESDETVPYSIYGETKLLGEQYIKEYSNKYFIIRTAWLYGSNGNNFMKTMIKLGSEKRSINVVNDQIGSPTNANDLVYHILKLILTDKYGVYHCTGKGECSWYDFSREIMKVAKLNCDVKPCTSLQFKRKAKRPEYSVLCNDKIDLAIGNKMRLWTEAAKEYIENEKYK